MKIRTLTIALLMITTGIYSCQNINKTPENQAESPSESSSMSDDALMDKIQKQTFQYFWEGAEPTSGLARERIHIDGEYP
ncbi:MAG: glucoamylase family protein, partial [Sphingobacterium sp.]